MPVMMGHGPARGIGFTIAFLVIACAAAGGCLDSAKPLLETGDPAPTHGIWSPGPPLPWPILAQSGVEFASEAFVVGPVTFSDGSSMGVVLRLDSDERWNLQPFVPFRGLRFDLSVVADTLYVIGRTEEEVALFAWDPDNREWGVRPSPPGGTSSAAVSSNQRLYLVGGIGDSKIFVYEPPAGRWREAPGATPRMDPLAFAVEDRVFLFGPTRTGGSPLEVLDTRTGRWEGLGPTPIRHSRPLTASSGDRLHFFGGLLQGSATPGREHLVFDVIDGRWDTLPDIPTPRADGAAFRYDGGLCLVGGEEDQRDVSPQPAGTVDKYVENR